MKLWQKRMISPSLLPLGLKLAPPLPPPIGRPVSAFLKVCSKARNLRIDLVDAGVEADAALIGADRIVVLDAVAALDADIVVVVLPADAEGDDPVGLGDAAQDLPAVIFLLVGDEVENVLGDFLHRLDEFGLARIAALHALHEAVQIDMPVPVPAHASPPWLAARPVARSRAKARTITSGALADSLGDDRR